MADSTFHFVIASDYAQMREVQKALLDCVEAHGYDQEALFAIKLALEEGLVNAIKHGNQMDVTKTVTVDATINSQKAEFVVQDQGKGFSRKKVPDPTKAANREKSSGRGLLLIESYMNDVSYSDGGRRLTMVFKKEGRPIRE